MTQLKLRSLIEGVENIASNQPTSNEPKREWTAAEKKAALEKISEYGKYGKFLYREYGLMELAHNLSEIVKSAEELAIHETNRAAIDEKHAWFDESTVKKNFQDLSKISENFKKLAKEAHTLEQRMQAAYDDGKHLIERYYEIKQLEEGMVAVSKIQPKK